MRDVLRWGFHLAFAVAVCGAFYAWGESINEERRVSAEECARAQCGSGKRGVRAHSNDRNAWVCFCDPILGGP